MEEENRYGGVGLNVVNNYSGEPTYLRVWSPDHPTDEHAPTEVVCGGGAVPPDYNACMSTVTHCSTPDKPHHDYGNHLREGMYLEVGLYTVEQTTYGEDTWGEELERQRWDDLECFKGYTLVLQPGPRAELYRCDGCLDPAKWRNPLPSTRV